MAAVRERFGIPNRIDRSVTEYPGWNGAAYIRYYTIVWVDEGEPQLKAHVYLDWCYRDETGSYGPLRAFDIPFDGYGQWDPHPAGGELVDPGATSDEDSDPPSDLFETDTESEGDESMEWESDPEPKPMDLEPEPVDDSEEEPVETESEPDSMDSEPEPDDASESSGSDPDWLP